MTWVVGYIVNIEYTTTLTDRYTVWVHTLLLLPVQCFNYSEAQFQRGWVN